MPSRTPLQIAIETYEDALLRGLCRDGALEVAVGAVGGIDRKGLLAQLEKPMHRAGKDPNIQIKRIYEPPNATDGVRVLVDRLWPRGVSKKNARVEAWFKDLAPTAVLRKWFGHDPARWEDFRHRYSGELDTHSQRIAELLKMATGRTVTFVYAAKDEQHNNAVALRDYLSARVSANAAAGDSLVTAAAGEVRPARRRRR